MKKQMWLWWLFIRLSLLAYFVLIGPFVLKGGMALAESITTLYINANAAMGEGRYEEAADFFDNILKVDPIHHRAHAGYSNAVYSAHMFKNRMEENLPLAAERLTLAIQLEERRERWKLLGDIQKARAIILWDPLITLEEVPPDTLWAAREFWGRAVVAYQFAENSRAEKQAGEIGDRIDRYLINRYELALLPANTLIHRCKGGYLPYQREFEECQQLATAGRPFQPDDPRLDQLILQLQRSRARTIGALSTKASQAEEGNHWVDLEKYARHILDLNSDDDVGSAFLVTAEEYLHQVARKKKDLKTAENSGDHDLLRRTADWLIENTDRPDEFIASVLAANRGIFRTALESKNWEKAKGCIEFTERYGLSAGRMRGELFVREYMYYLVGGIVIVGAMIFALFYLRSKKQRRKKGDTLLQEVESKILSQNLSEAWLMISESWVGDVGGRADRLTVLLCEIVESPHFHEWIDESGNRDELLSLLSNGFETTRDPKLKVRTAWASACAGWSESTWKDSVASLRHYRDSYPVIDELWLLPLKCLQGEMMGPSWYPDEPEDRHLLYEEMAEDLHAFVKRTPKTVSELQSIIGKALEDSSGSAIRWVCGIEFMNREMWSEAELYLRGFLFGHDGGQSKEEIDLLRVRWASFLASRKDPISTDEALMLSEVLASPSRTAEEREYYYTLISVHLDGLSLDDRRDTTISLLSEPFKRDSLPLGGIKIYTAALHDRSSHSKDEIEVFSKALGLKYRQEYFLYFARLTAKYDGWGTFEQLLRTELATHLVDVVKLEGEVRQEFADRSLTSN